MGYILPAYGHVHLTEIRGTKVWNPLARGGIGPYEDRTVPEVDAISMRPARSLVALDPGKVCGKVSVVAVAHDITPLAVVGLFAGFPVSPARVTWSFAKLGARPLVRNRLSRTSARRYLRDEGSGTSMRVEASRTRRGSRTASSSCRELRLQPRPGSRHAQVRQRRLHGHRHGQRRARQLLRRVAAFHLRQPAGHPDDGCPAAPPVDQLPNSSP